MSGGVPAPCFSSISRIAKPKRSWRYSSSSLAGKCHPQRTFATSPYDEEMGANTRSTGSSEVREANSLPRWQATPPQMKAPFRTRPLPSKPNEYKVNDSPHRLRTFYVNFFGENRGENGNKTLTEEVKWLAVTHKSFDHGRRGYNDRLAFLGMMNYIFMQDQL